MAEMSFPTIMETGGGFGGMGAEVSGRLGLPTGIGGSLYRLQPINREIRVTRRLVSHPRVAILFLWAKKDPASGGLKSGFAEMKFNFVLAGCRKMQSAPNYLKSLNNPIPDNRRLYSKFNSAKNKHSCAKHAVWKTHIRLQRYLLFLL